MGLFKFLDFRIKFWIKLMLPLLTFFIGAIVQSNCEQIAENMMIITMKWSAIMDSPFKAVLNVETTEYTKLIGYLSGTTLKKY